MFIKGVVAHLRRMGWEVDPVDDVVRPLMDDLLEDDRGGFEVLSHAEKHLLDDGYASPYSSVERAVARGFVRASEEDTRVVSIDEVRAIYARREAARDRVLL